jgi:hypothetical protein
MEQAAELAFVDHRDSRREPPRTRDSLDWSNRPAPSLLAEAAPAQVRREPGLRRTRNSAPVSRQRGGSLTASALPPRSVLASSDALSLREFAQLSIIGVFVLLSPVLVFLAAIAVEIVIGVLVDAGGPSLPAFIAAGAVGWLLLRKLWRREGGVPVEA